MSLMKAPENTPVWVNENNCKACNLCVAYCPAGVLTMVSEPKTILGAMVKVVYPDSCIGCSDCELECPDFAIMVADRKEYKFSKLSKEAKERAEAIKKNHFFAREEDLAVLNA